MARPRSTAGWGRRRLRVTAGLTLALIVVLGPALAACGSDPTPGGSAAPGTTTPPLVGTRPLVAEAAFPVALLGEPDGSLLFAERLTGHVRRVAPGGTLDPEPVAAVGVVGAETDQRGLLGLARDHRGRLFAAWTRSSDGRLVVGQVDVDPPRLVWEGPLSADLADGGHLAVQADGTLVIGIGDLLQPRDLADDPSVPNRKVLALDPEGPPDQAPRILSTGWNNPFALAVGADGTVWVGDNTGAEGPERIGRGDRPPSEATAMGGPGQGEVVPSALVVLDGNRLAMCTYLGRDLREVDVSGGRARLTGRTLAAPCATGAARLADGRVALALPDRILVTDAAP